MSSFIKALCCAFVIAGTLSAQSATLATTFASNNGQSGNMFDLVALNDVTICSFDVNIDAGSWDIEIYTKASAYLPDVNNAAAWGAPIASLTGVVSNGLNAATPLPVGLNVQIPAGATQAFYVTVTNGTAMNYTNGTTTGALFTSDANLEFYEGSGLAYPFTANFNPRIWNGNINYEQGFTACPPPPLGDWQANSAACSADINGIPGTGAGPIQFEGCVGTQFQANISGLANPWDVIVTINGAAQPNLNSTLVLNLLENIINLDPFAPNSLFLGALSFSGLFSSLPSTAFTLGLPNGELDWQVIVLNGASADGLTLSAANCASGGGVSAPGPTADDTPIVVDLTAAPFNIAAGVNYYGTNYTSISVMPNGRVGFGAGDTDFSATPAEFIADEPSLGVWSDFSPNVAGSVTVNYDCTNVLSVSWAGVPYFGQAATSSSFDVEHDFSAGTWTLANLTGIGLGDGTDQVLIGFSSGLPGGATDPGAQDFTQGANTVPLPTDAIYEISGSDLIGLPGGALGGTGPVSPVNNVLLIGAGGFYSVN